MLQMKEVFDGSSYLCRKDRHWGAQGSAGKCFNSEPLGWGTWNQEHIRTQDSPAPNVWMHSTPSIMTMIPRVCQPTKCTRLFFSRLRMSQKPGHDHHEKRWQRNTGVNNQDLPTCGPSQTCHVNTPLDVPYIHTATYLMPTCFVRVAILEL